MRKTWRAIVFVLCFVGTSYSMRPGKYWVCNHPSHKTATHDVLQSDCEAIPQATAEAEAHRKIHPKNVTVFPCAL
jgi:hypothetical protein